MTFSIHVYSLASSPKGEWCILSLSGEGCVFISYFYISVLARRLDIYLCNPTPEFSDILGHPTKLYDPKVFLFTKIKSEYSDILDNPTHFPGPLVCRIRQVPLYYCRNPTIDYRYLPIIVYWSIHMKTMVSGLFSILSCNITVHRASFRQITLIILICKDIPFLNYGLYTLIGCSLL